MKYCYFNVDKKSLEFNNFRKKSTSVKYQTVAPNSSTKRTCLNITRESTMLEKLKRVTNVTENFRRPRLCTSTSLFVFLVEFTLADFVDTHHPTNQTWSVTKSGRDTPCKVKLT